MAKQTHQGELSIQTSAAKTGPVECLGKTFPSDDARREYFLAELRKKLQDPNFRKIEGFPIGEDEDILALSDPPYYTACPNPWLADFVRHYGKPYTKKDTYHCDPFAADVSEGKNHPIYNAHSYHTKVPHRAIMRYILHYTEPGDIVFDGFAGTGMTGVAAQLCGDNAEVRALGYRVEKDGTILDELGKAFSKLGARRAILNDLSPAASFFAYSYNTPVDPESFDLQVRGIVGAIDRACGWMYETLHTDHETCCRVNYIVWSDVFVCPNCGGDVVFFAVAIDRKTGKVQTSFPCEHCNALIKKSELERKQETYFDAKADQPAQRAVQTPVLVNYTFQGSRATKSPGKADADLVDRIDKQSIKQFYPDDRIDRDIDIWYERDYRSLGLYSLDGFFTKRNLLCLSELHDAIRRIPNGWDRRLLFVFTGTLQIASRMSSFRYDSRNPENTAGGILKGALYVPSLSKEACVTDLFARRARAIRSLFKSQKNFRCDNILTATSSSSSLTIPDNSIDYLFFDPPFGSNIIYSELSLIWESWLRVYSNDRQEAVVHRRRRTGNKLDDYRAIMLQCFALAFRVLKPGRWLTVEFSNTQRSVWNSIQTALQEVGFVIANVAGLDKQQGSFKAVTTPTAVKQDLVISAYKPNGGLEARFLGECETEAGVWDFVRTHLRNLPPAKTHGGQLEYVTEREPRILYDRTVAFYVRHGVPVPLSSSEFRTGLAEKFPDERDGMYFLPDQAAEYDRKRIQAEGLGQLTIFVEDERSAVDWLRQFLKRKPSKTQDITPEFLKALGQSWKKWETRPELRFLLDQYFLCYGGDGEVPPQIHSLLSTDFKELRKLQPDDPLLRAKAKDRWYVPDPKNQVQVEQMREKRLIEEFWTYLPPGMDAERLKHWQDGRTQTLPGMEPELPMIPKGKRLKIVRTEAVRVGFTHCSRVKNYLPIVAVARYIPEDVVSNDDQLQMIVDLAEMRLGL